MNKNFIKEKPWMTYKYMNRYHEKSIQKDAN